MLLSTRLLVSAFAAVSILLNPASALTLAAPTPPVIDEVTQIPIYPLPVVQRLIQCESSGRNVTIIDSNGLHSRGILQFQDKTWEWFSKLSGIKGTSTNPNDAIRMANWAVQNGYGPHWTCFRLLRL
jgi:hypothetical protein